MERKKDDYCKILSRALIPVLQLWFLPGKLRRRIQGGPLGPGPLFLPLSCHFARVFNVILMMMLVQYYETGISCVYTAFIIEKLFTINAIEIFLM